MHCSMSIKYMHNSNRQLHQVTLSGEALLEYKFYVIGFVPADVVRLKKDIWFSKLEFGQIIFVEQFLSEMAQMCFCISSCVRTQESEKFRF